MKVRENSNKPVTHPRTRSRRERALAQRQKELAEWQNPDSERVKKYTSELQFADPDKAVARKILGCEQDIEHLTKKLKGSQS